MGQGRYKISMWFKNATRTAIVQRIDFRGCKGSKYFSFFAKFVSSQAV